MEIEGRKVEGFTEHQELLKSGITVTIKKNVEHEEKKIKAIRKSYPKLKEQESEEVKEEGKNATARVSKQRASKLNEAISNENPEEPVNKAVSMFAP